MAPEAWYMNSSNEDQREEHRLSPNVSVPLEAMAALGIEYYKLNAEDWEHDSTFEDIRTSRGYNYHDIVTISPDLLPNYEVKIRDFFSEHIHTDEEIRYIIDGSGYFDVRDVEDQWIRVKCQKGDLLIFPPGIYHRFTLDTKNYIKALRMFAGEPVWTPHNRPADEFPARQIYVKKYIEHNRIHV